MSRLDGKAALITGGCNGIGLASARQFAAKGAQVMITGTCKVAVDDALAHIGAGATGSLGDVADIAHHEVVAAEMVERFGGIDIYVVNVGIDTIDRSLQLTEAEYEAHFSAHTKGVYFSVQKMASVMRNGGAIIITGPIASDMPSHAIYAASKAAIFAFARCWAHQLKDRRIRVYVLSPGLWTHPSPTSLGRFGLPDEFGSAALYLASDASSLVTGIRLCVDGGISLL